MISKHPPQQGLPGARAEGFARLLAARHTRAPRSGLHVDAWRAHPARRQIHRTATLLEIGTLFRTELMRRSGAGMPLDTELRRRLMRPLGFDPGLARLHVDPASAEAARLLDAEAFTVGKDIFFARGRYRPETRFGLGLLAHELAHVGQQSAPQHAVARLFTPYGGDRMEREAQEKAGHAVQQLFPPQGQRRRQPPALARLTTQRVVANEPHEASRTVRTPETPEPPSASCPAVTSSRAVADWIYARMQAELTPSLPFHALHLTP